MVRLVFHVRNVPLKERTEYVVVCKTCRQALTPVETRQNGVSGVVVYEHDGGHRLEYALLKSDRNGKNMLITPDFPRDVADVLSSTWRSGLEIPPASALNTLMQEKQR
ncbi:MAG: hypothetical protein QXY50_02800 [Candidatus Caldarchaeum sp.]